MAPPPKLVVKECIVCYQNTVHDDDANNDLAVVELKSCKCRRTCRTCFATYLRTEISEGRVSLTCPECPELLHPADVQKILAHRSQSTQHIAASSGAEIIDATFLKYEEFMVRRVLAREEPDARWCPAPNCNYAVIANGCASCPRLECRREGCGTAFCYHCKQLWHPDKPCNLFSTAATIFSLSTNRAAGTTSTAAQTAAAGNNIILQALPSSLLKYADPTANLGLIKPCPTCQALIAKTEDGSCNHMTCAMCGTDFCWLCLKPVSDLHFLSPSGCTFWGKRPWSRKKKVWCQVGTLIGAPVGIALVAGLALPAILVGVPVFTGRKIYRKMEKRKKWKRNMAVTLGVVGAAVGAPLAAVFAVGVGVPCMVAYVYGVVPFALVRNSFGGNSSSNNNAAAAAAAAGELRNSTVTTTNLESAEEKGPPQKSARIIAVDEHGHAVILNTIAATATSSSMAATGLLATPTIKNNSDAKQSAAAAEVPPPSAKKIPFFSHLLRRSNRSNTTDTHGGEMSSSSNKPHAAANVDTMKTDAARRSSNHHTDQLNIDNGNSCGCRCHSHSRVEQTTSSIPCEATTPVLVSSVSSDLVSASAAVAHASHSSEVICTCCGCGGGGGRCSSVADHNRSRRRSLSRYCDGTIHQRGCRRQQSTTTTTTASSSTTVDDAHSCSIISTNVSLDAAAAAAGCRNNNNTAGGCCSGSMQGMSSMSGKKRCCSNSTTNAAVMTTTTSVTRHEEPTAAAAAISPIVANSSSNDNASMNGLAGSLACAKCGVAGASSKIAHVTTTTTTTRDSQSYYAGCLDHRRRRCDVGSNHDDVKSQVMVASAELACHSVKQHASYEPKPNADAAAAGVLMMIQPSSSSMTSSSAHTHSSSSNMVRKARAGDSVSVTALSRDDGVSVNEDIVGSGGGGGVGAGGIFKYDNEILSVGSGKSSKKSYFK